MRDELASAGDVDQPKAFRWWPAAVLTFRAGTHGA